MTAASTRSMAPLDSIWLAMDRPHNLMVIVAVVFLGEVPDWDDVSRLVQTRVLERYPVFRQKVRPAGRLGGRPRWEDDEDFSLDRHLHRVALPPPGDDATLQRYMEEHVSTPLDVAHPLWELHLVEGHGDGGALFFRVHHALADGLALAQVLLSLTDAPDADPADPAEQPGAAGVPGTTTDGVEGAHLLSFGFDLARSAVSGARRFATPGGLRDTAALAVDTVRVAADLLLAHNPDNALAGRPAPAKRIAWTGPIPLEDTTSLRRMTGATLNDVLLSAMAAALGTYQEGRGLEPIDLITMVPVNLRDADAPLPPELGNDFTLVYFRYPSATGAPLARLAETKRRMDWLKHSPEVALTHLLMEVIGRVGRGVDRPVIDFFANKALGVTTNVIGPRSPRVLAGVPVEGVLGWVPGSGSHTVGVCIFTYAGTVRVGVVTDAGVVPDPQTIVAAFETELELLTSLAPAAGTSAARRKVRPRAH